MFKPLLHKHDGQTHIGDVPPDEPREVGLAETEQAADAQAAAARAREDEAAFRIIPLRDEAGGVDASDVLHAVRSVEVHACVESDLCSVAASPAGDATFEHTHTPRSSSSHT